MKYVVINTKKYFDKYHLLKFLDDFRDKLSLEKTILSCDSSFFDLLKSEKLSLCLQSFDELNKDMLAVYNINYSLVGHRDDRILKNETNCDINNKIKELLNNDIFPILCIGEEFYEENIEKTLSTIFVQINEALEGLSSESVEKVFIAYEPFWAISDGKNYVELDFDRIKLIIEGINKKFEEKYSINPKILYGGSISNKNINEINKLEIDGFLIGSASTEKDALSKIFDSIT